MAEITEEIDVRMFKAFAFTYHNQTITAKDIKSDKLLKLLTYCLYHHGQQLPSSKLIDYLWSMEDVDNPIGALKNLIYRLRTLLKKKLGLTDLIITGRGSYAVNTAYQINLDTEKFDQLSNQLHEHATEEVYDEIIEVYRGKFMPEIEYDQYIMTKNVYYHSAMMGIIKDYCHLLEDKHDYQKMEKVANYAVSLDKLEESSYELLIKALYLEKRYKQASEVYKKAVDLLYRYLGTNPSEGMLDLYNLIQKETHEGSASIYDIQKNLETSDEKGAFLCEYGSFRQLYSMQARMMDRLGVSTHLCLLTVDDPEVDQGAPDEKKRKYIEKIMQRIKISLIDGLRIGDIVTRYSQNQYLVLLPSCTYEDARMVMKRVLKKIIHALNNKNIQIDVAVQEVKAPEQ